MADKKISDFTAAGSGATDDLYEIETAAGNSRKMTGQQVATMVRTTTGGLILLEEFTFTGAESSKTFSSIAGDYSDLLLVFNGRSDRAGQATSTIGVRVNGDSTAANYYSQHINASNATINTNANAGSVGHMLQVTIPGATATAGHAALFRAEIGDYAATTFQKYAQSDAFYSSAASAVGHTIFRSGGHWLSTSAITSVTLLDTNTANFTSGSTVRLYARG